MLQYVECVDALTRKALLATPRSDSMHVYFAEWAAQLDVTPHATMPPGLRGVAHGCNLPTHLPTLIDTPFSFVNGVPKTDPPKPKPVRTTTYRPRRILDILTQKSIDDLVDGIYQHMGDLAAMAKYGEDFQRRARVVVIKQSGFQTKARDTVWDLTTVLYDDLGAYWAPVQDGPTGSHLDRKGVLFDELGKEYEDRETRYGVRDGY